MDTTDYNTLIKVLLLQPDKDGYFQTAFGRKTLTGLRRTIKAIIEDKAYPLTEMDELIKHFEDNKSKVKIF